MHLPQVERGLRGAGTANLLGQGRPLARGKPVEERKERQCQLSARKVRPERLPDALLPAEEIGQVVVDLVGDAQVAAEAVRRLDVTLLVAREL